MSRSPQRAGARGLAADGLPERGFIRIDEIVLPRGPLPISKSTWWAGIKAGRFPSPVKIGPRVSAWNVAEVRAVLRHAH
jgi:predicted DNA-binding transcriptional regulator AlpA